MVQIDDALLMAYADGELDDDSARDVEAALERDFDARERLRQFQETASWVRMAYASDLREPVPLRLVAGLRDVGRPRRWARPAAALAASVAAVALGFGFVAGRFAAPFQLEAVSGVSIAALAPNALGRALETTPNNATVALAGFGGDHRSVTPRQTFVSGDGRFCRRFDLSDGVAGVACRADDGSWEVIALARVEDGADVVY